MSASVFSPAGVGSSFNRIVKSDDPQKSLSDLQLDILNPPQLVDLHSNLAAKNPPVSEHILFDLEDRILREVAKDPDYLKKYFRQPQCSFLASKIEEFVNKGSYFHPIDGERGPRRKINRPIKVLKLSLENQKNFVGGIGAVFTGLKEAHARLGGMEICSAHPLYEKDKPEARKYEFLGVVHHKYEDQDVCSSIYKDIKNAEYLIQPDPAFRNIFCLPSSKNVYENTAFSSYNSRILYYGSAAAALAAGYSGRENDSDIDIIHADLPTVGACAFPLIKQTNRTRLAEGLPAQTCLSVMHGPVSDSHYIDPLHLRQIGVEKTGYFFVDLMQKAMESSDKVVFVSSRMASEALSSDPSWSFNRHRVLHSSGKVTAIRNGVMADLFDVTNENSFKRFTLKKTFSSDGTETTDYVGYKADIKQQLFQAGLIADPKLPLVLFVGRYASEKGIDTLVKLVEGADQKTVQFATMGVNCGEGHLVSRLQNMAKSSHKASLRCYTKKEDQSKVFLDSEVSVGQLMRAAADITIVPSHAEACGLVAMEGQCVGSLIIAPYHQGLREICRPHGYLSPEGNPYTLNTNANAICYRDHSSVSQATEALDTGLYMLKQMSSDERNKMAQRIHNQAIRNYSWYCKDGEVVSGAVVAYHNLYEDLADPALNRVDRSKIQLVEPIQAPIVPVKQGNSVFDIARRGFLVSRDLVLSLISLLMLPFLYLKSKNLFKLRKLIPFA